MTSQEKKAYLKQYLEAKDRFNDIMEEMARIRSDAERITPIITDMPGGSHVNDKIAIAVERLEACAQKLEKESDRMQKTMESISGMIAALPDAQLRRMMQLRYIGGHTWEEIAVLMNYSYRNVCYLHGKALSQINFS